MINYTTDLLPPDIQFNNSYLSDFSNQVVSEISYQKDSIIWEVLRENNIDISNLTELVKQCKFIKYEDNSGKIKYTTLNYNGRDLLQIYEPEISNKDYKFKVEVKYKKLYD